MIGVSPVDQEDRSPGREPGFCALSSEHVLVTHGQIPPLLAFVTLPNRTPTFSSLVVSLAVTSSRAAHCFLQWGTLSPACTQPLRQREQQRQRILGQEGLRLQNWK